MAEPVGRGGHTTHQVVAHARRSTGVAGRAGGESGGGHRPRPDPRTGTVIVFARVPRAGRVKTRLAASVGDAEALRVHRALLRRALALAAAASPTRAELCIDGDDSDGECARLAAGFGLRLSAQRGADLGARMHTALAAALAAGRLPVLIGSDCPSMRVSDIADAFAALRDHDAVFAPAEDGGYVLVGVARPLPVVFDGPAWGGDRVMARTRELLAAGGHRWAELRTQWDLDDHAGWLRWRAEGDAR